MTTPPLWMPIADIAPDMHLGADLLDAAGQTILTAGSRLDARRLEELARQGIASLPVVPPDPAAGDPTTAREKEIRRQLKRRFAQAGDNPASRALFQVLLTRQLGKAED